MMSEAFNKEWLYFFLEAFELGDEGEVIRIDFLLLFFVEILDLVEDMFKSDGDGSLMNGKLANGLLDFVGCWLHEWL